MHRAMLEKQRGAGVVSYTAKSGHRAVLLLASSPSFEQTIRVIFFKMPVVRKAAGETFGDFSEGPESWHAESDGLICKW